LSKKTVIGIDHVSVAYQRKTGVFRHEQFWALKDVSFEVFDGETLGIIGRNGAGKSTLLRLLAGIAESNSGSVVNAGVRVSLLSLQAGFIQHLTGRENAILGGMMLGLTKEKILKKMDEIYNYADIGEFFDQPVRCYSSGMRARLGFSVAVHVDPDVMLLDEVLGVGDADFRKKSGITMREKIKSNKTVVLVSHNMGLIAEICDRVVWLHDRKVKMVGDTEHVLQIYKSQ